MRKTKCNKYYVYTDPKTNNKYFHNAITNECVWFPPCHSIFLDPKTCQPVKVNMVEIDKLAEEVLHEDQLVPCILPPPTHFRGKLSGRASSANILNLGKNNTKRRKLMRSPTLLISFSKKSDNAFYLPEAIKLDSAEYDVRKFAVDNLNTRMRGNIFKKKQIPPDELLVYSADPSVIPILKTTPEKSTKKCVEIFNLIMEYCQQNPKAQPSVFVEMLNKDHALIDETFIILLKLIRNNPSEEGVTRIWDIILTICTFFPPSKVYQPFVRHVIAEEAMGTKSINTIAKMAYIRLAARCDCGEIGAMQPANWVNLIPTHTVQDTFVFGAPLLELIYSQRRTAPKCTIPLFMDNFVKELFKAGCNRVEGTFRLPGNKMQIDLMVEGIHNGVDVFKGADLRDLASLFKKWLGDLPEPIVPMCMYDDLVAALKDKTIMEFIEKLPIVNHDTLGYLIGFLQEFIKSADVTLMGITPVSMIFGANVVRIVSNDPIVMKNMTDNGKKFMAYLIENWDTSFIYPLPIDYVR